MARTSERLGDKPAAARYYRKLADLWSAADAPLQVVATTAERRLAALEDSSGR